MAGSIVQQWGAEGAAAATTLPSGNAPSNVAAGNFLVILSNSDTNVSCTVTQNSGTATLGTITQRETQTEAGTAETTKVYTCEVTGAGSLDLLATFGASDANRMLFAWEVTDVDAFFGSTSATDTGSNPTPTLTVNVTSPPAFGLMVGVDVQSGTPSTGSGWTSFGTFGSAVHLGRAQTRSVAVSGNLTGNFGNASLDRNNTFMVVFTEPAPPAITAQPVQQTAPSGATATFNATTTGATSFQWQEQIAGAWTNVSTGTGGTSEDYTTATLSSADNGRQFRLQATNAAGTTDSAEVFLFISGQPITGKGRNGWGSAWWRRSVRKAGSISGLKLATLRKRPSHGPNFDNEDFVAAWNDWFFPAASGGTHTTTGALAADAATIAGTAAHSALHATTGALASQDATIAGTAAHATLHATSGALSAQAATVAGTAAHQHATTGALSAQAATIAGSAAHQHATSGALSAQAAAIAGTAAHFTLHTSTGALVAQDATIAGTAADEHSNTGALTAQAATIAGTAAHLTLHTSTGALTAQDATIAGAAADEHASTGALTAQDATIAGTAAHLTLHTTTGALAAQDAAIAGSADHTTAGASHSTSGALTAQDATVAGAATHLTLHTSTGALTAQDATIAGTAAHQHTATGALAADAATISGAAAHLTLHTSTGALAADAAAISGAAAHEHATTGALAAQAATVDGTATHSAAGTHDATGALTAQDATMSGVAEHIGTGDSVLSPKFLGSPNVVIRKARAEEKPADAEPLPAQITNVPDAPLPVKLSPSIMDLLGFAPPVTPLPIETPEIPEFKVTVKPRKEPPAPDPAPEVAPLPPPPPPPPPVPRAEVDQMQVEAAAREKALSAQIASLEAEAAEVENALVRARARLAKVKQALVQRKQTVAQRKMNRQRAEEITRRLLKDLAEED